MLSLSQFSLQLRAAVTFYIAEITDQVLSGRCHLNMLAIFLIFILGSGLKLSRAVGTNLCQYLTLALGLIGNKLLLFLLFGHTLTIIINMINNLRKNVKRQIYIDRQMIVACWM